MRKFNLTKPILFSISLLDFMGFTVAATIFPELFINKNIHFLPVAWTHSADLLAVGVALGLYPLGQFLSASIFGVLSDRHGRRPILLITMLGTIFASLCTALSITFNLYYLLFVSRFILGAFAGNVSVAQASMVDISDEKSRASNISLIQLSLGLAWVFGAPLGSFLSNSSVVPWFNFSVPFWFLTGVLFLVTLFLFGGYSETLLQQNVEHKKIHPLMGVKLTMSGLTDKKAADIFWVWLIFIAGWALFLQFLPTFFIINFHYSTNTLGPLLAFMGGTFACTQIFIARRIFKKVAVETILRLMMFIPAVAALSIGFATGWWSLHIPAFLFPFSMGFILPALLGAISKRGSGHEQGGLLGKAQSIQALMTIVVTMVGGQLLGFSRYMTTLIGGSLMLFAWILYLFLSHIKKTENDDASRRKSFTTTAT